MKMMRHWQLLGFAGFALMSAAVTGCQTNVAGMTLPSGHYLQHPPQYFAPSPAFPLQRPRGLPAKERAHPSRIKGRRRNKSRRTTARASSMSPSKAAA